MSDFLAKIDNESTTSRYQQQLIPQEEGKQSRTDGISKGQLVPDSLIKYNSAGGEIIEKDIKPQLEAGKYGKVRVVTETHAGHVILVDETSGNERIYILHPNGTYTNIEPELMTIKVETDQKTFVNGIKDMEVSKEHNEIIHKDHNEIIHKNHNVQIDQNETIKIDGNEKETIKGNETVEIGGNAKMKIVGNHQETVGGTWDKKIGSTTNIKSGGPITMKAPMIFLN